MSVGGRTMRRTTPPKPVDVEEVFPELAALARMTVRLHPRPGTPQNSDSSMGGPLLWPSDEPWPRCAELDRHGKMLVELPDEPLPLVPVLQLFARDVPELPFPEGTDLCQVLWCPLDHDPDSIPEVTLRWRDSTTITTPRHEPAPIDAHHSQGDYLPSPCVLAPERVREHPDYSDVPWELSQRIDAWEEQAEHDWFYQSHLSAAPGTKVGGWPYWIQGPVWPSCTEGHTMEHLLTIASDESDGSSWETWTPIEDQERITWHPNNVNGRPVQIALVPDQEPAGIMIGDAGDLYLFICLHCQTRPILTIGQCS
jgi:hypothetical protein